MVSRSRRFENVFAALKQNVISWYPKLYFKMFCHTHSSPCLNCKFDSLVTCSFA